MIGLSLCVLLSSLDTSITNVALPAITRALNASFQDAQWIVLSYLVAVTTLVVSAGRLGDLAGRRRLLLGGVLLFTLSSAMCAFAPTLPLLVAARALQGLSAAIMTALALAFVSTVVSKERTGSAMGLLGTMSAVGTAIGPSVGGLLVARLPWGSIFLINVPLGIMTAVLVYRSLPADERTVERRVPFDVRGTLILAATLGSYTIALTTGRGHFGPTNVALLLAALAGAIGFVFAQRRTASPLVSFATLRNRQVSRGSAMSVIVTSVVMSTLVVGPFYLSGALSLSSMHVGLIMSCGPIAAALTGFPAGRLVDSLGSRGVTQIGLGAMFCGAASLPLTTAFGVSGYILPLVVLTSGYALFQAANNTAVMKNVGAGERGVVSGVLNLARNLGLISGVALMGAIFSAASGTSSVTLATPNAIATGLRVTFAFATALLAVAFAIARSADDECVDGDCALQTHIPPLLRQSANASGSSRT